MPYTSFEGGQTPITEGKIHAGTKALDQYRQMDANEDGYKQDPEPANAKINTFRIRSQPNPKKYRRRK